uniref:Ovule protein n=1 Tax=Ascaris lumbricoides TaxID=6252 RepID=A0A0M3I914_ASCLU
MTFKKKWNINILQRRSNQLWDDIQQIHNFFRPKRQSSALIAVKEKRSCVDEQTQQSSSNKATSERS